MKRNLVTLSIICMSIVVYAQNPVNDFVNSKLHRTANISIAVRDLKTNKMLFSHRAENAAIPASTMKLITTATALEIFGAGHRFTTTLETDGYVTSDSILNGNLYIRGNGDPTLGSSKIGDAGFLSEWVYAVRKAGIRQINGDIIADATAFDTEGINPKWLWEDIGNYYASGVYGIAYKDNTYMLGLRSGAVGTTPEIVGITPDIPEITFKNYLKSTTIRFDSAYIYGSPFDFNRTIYGEIPANRTNFTIKGDIPRPGLILARDFVRELNSNGIAVTGNGTDEVTGGKRTVIFLHQSPPLSQIIKEINIDSNNMYAEQLFRHIAQQKGNAASNNESIRILKDFWRGKGLPVEELFMYDGSGLSPSNAVSANFFVSLLTYMDQSKNREVFRESLPVSGKNGTLKNFLNNTPLAGKVEAKSGTIARVKSYAGYINTDERKLAFAITVNNPNSGSTSETTKKIEEFLVLISELKN